MTLGPRMRRSGKLIILLCVALSALAFGLYRSGVLMRKASASATDAAALRHAAVQNGQTLYRSIRTVPLAEIGEPARLREIFDNASIGTGPNQISRESVSDLLSQSAEFLYYRYGQPSVAEYKRWRQDRGYTFIDAVAAKRDGVVARYKVYTGKEYPGDDAIGQVFDDLWERSLSFGRGGNRVAGIAKERKGLAVTFGRLTPEDMSAWPAVSGDMSVAEWHGYSSGGHESWWLAPDDGALGQVRKKGFADVASVGVIAEFAGGDRYPLRLLFYRSADDGRWWLEAVQALNFENERFSMLDY